MCVTGIDALFSQVVSPYPLGFRGLISDRGTLPQKRTEKYKFGLMSIWIRTFRVRHPRASTNVGVREKVAARE